MSAISTHVLDTVSGQPASGIPVRLERVGPGGEAVELGRGRTDGDGRILDFGVTALRAGTYRLVFETERYSGTGTAFFPEVVVTFTADGRRPRYHVPLLLSRYGYTTYLGS